MNYIALWGGRKFLLCLGCGAVNSILLWFGKLDSNSYELIILGTVGTFIAGNVMAGRPPRRDDEHQQ